MGLADIVAQHLGGNPDTGYGLATLTRVTPGSRGAVLTAGNNPTSTNYPCTARLGRRRSTVVAGAGLARAIEPTVVILRVSLPDGVRPKVGDRVAIGGATYALTSDGSESRGGTEAAWECLCRAGG